MSYELLQTAARVKDLTPHERCVLITLADRANHKTNKCWPSVGTMAQDTGVSEREVHRALKRFRALGLITISGKTKYGTNVYSLHLKEKPASAEEEPEDCPLDDAAPAQLAAEQCHAGSAVLTMWHTNKGTETRN
jgi:DNA-binding transcriptional regulator YhcF (GntR family)